jgi:hypothetical protein
MGALARWGIPGLLFVIGLVLMHQPKQVHRFISGVDPKGQVIEREETELRLGWPFLAFISHGDAQAEPRWLAFAGNLVLAGGGAWSLGALARRALRRGSQRKT